MRELERALAGMAVTVKEQLSDALTSFHDRDPAGADRVVERDDQVDNVYFALEDRIFEAIGNVGANVSEARRWRAALRVLSNLERIGDAACHIAKHSIMMAAEPAPGIDFDLADLSEIALRAMDEGVRGFIDQDLDRARSACELERDMDELYVEGSAPGDADARPGRGACALPAARAGGHEVPREDGGLRAQHR
ncbi:MAG: phosphate signaling complex PhoU family protein, partial [Candidatus Dormibacteraceae bacterium]